MDHLTGIIYCILCYQHKAFTVFNTNLTANPVVALLLLVSTDFIAIERLWSKELASLRLELDQRSDPSLNSASYTYPCGMVVIIFFILVSKKRFFRWEIFALGSGCTSWNHVLVDDSQELSHQSHASLFYAPELHNQA